MIVVLKYSLTHMHRLATPPSISLILCPIRSKARADAYVIHKLLAAA